jgi:hypothetical protein
MAPTPVATPNLIRDPGYLFWAPVGSTEPSHVAAASKFTDAWPVAWIPLGATQEGTQFTWNSPLEPIYAAEFLNPITYAPAEQSGNIAFGLLDFTLNSLKRAMNGGAISVVSGTGATEVSKFEAPEPADIVRCMIGWESLDNSIRIIGRQCLNAGEVNAAFRKGTDVGIIPCEFNFERPVSAKSWTIYGTSTRKGV